GGATRTPPKPTLASAQPAGPAGPTPPLPAVTEHDTFTPLLPGDPGVVAYGLDADGRLVRIDVDRGSVSRRVVSGVAAGAGAPLVARTSGVLVRRADGTAVLVPDDPSRPGARLVLTGDSWFLPAADPTEIWELTQGSV